MPSKFPGAKDTFSEPTNPSVTSLSDATNSGGRTHAQHHTDLGDAIEALQNNVALQGHDHSGTGAYPTGKLAQANTHEAADTDMGNASLHHTLGKNPGQAAPGNHNHDGVNSPKISASSFSDPTADVSWGGKKITNLGSPTTTTDAATKGYVDSAIATMQQKLDSALATRPEIRTIRQYKLTFPGGSRTASATIDLRPYGFTTLPAMTLQQSGGSAFATANAIDLWMTGISTTSVTIMATSSTTPPAGQYVGVDIVFVDLG